jgi:hypothetical protein
MKITEMFPSKYVKGEDLGGQAFTVTIAGVAAEKMRPSQASPEVEKYVLYTTEGKKGIILSKTLAQQIARIVASDDTDQWTGKKIKIYPEPQTVAGVPRVAIRARSASNGNGEAAK